MLYDTGAGAAHATSRLHPLRAMMVYVARMRLLERATGKVFQAMPSKHTKDLYLRTAFPQVKKIEEAQEVERKRRAMDWANIGPLQVVPPAGVKQAWNRCTAPHKV